MSQTREIVYGLTGQTVEFYPPESVRDVLGIPSSVTASVYSGTASNDDTPEFSPTVTVDSLSVTVSSNSGQTVSTTRNRVGLNSTTNVKIGTLYLLDSFKGQREVVEPKKVVDSINVDLVHDLQYDYQSSIAILKGIKCTFPVDDTWATTEGKILLPSAPSYRVVWQYTVDSVVRTCQTYIRLVRKPFRSTVTYQDVVARWPDILDGQPREMRGDKLARMIAGAEGAVRSDIISEGYKPEQFSDTEIIDRLVNLYLDYQIARTHRAPPDRDREAFILECKTEYGQLLTKMVTTLKLSLDTGTEGATTVEPVQRYFFVR